MSDQNALISVIIPCYNCGKWVYKCIEALENQTYKNFEVICVDDYSKDNTLEVLNSIKHKTTLNLIILQNDINMGPAKTRNKAISEAKGKYLAFCDADDWYDSNFLEVMYNEVVRTNAELVMCNYRKVYGSGKKSEDVKYITPEIREGIEKNRDDAIAYSKASLCLLMFDRKLTEGITMPDLRNGEDIAYVPCIESKANKISATGKVLYNYWIRGDSSSNKASPEIFDSLCNAFHFIELNIDEKDETVVEYIGIKTVLYGAMMNGLKAENSIKRLKQERELFVRKHKNWRSNKYMKLFSLPKKLFLFFIHIGFYNGAKVLAKIHAKISV